MSQDFTRPNSPALTKIVDDAAKGANIGQNYQAMKDGLRSALGLPPSDESSAFGFGLPDPPPSAAPLPEHTQQGNPTFEEVIYPSKNDRYVVTGYSQAEVDQKIARIKAALGVQ